MSGKADVADNWENLPGLIGILPSGSSLNSLRCGYKIFSSGAISLYICGDASKVVTAPRAGFISLR